jgi:predicted Zn-dependent protease
VKERLLDALSRSRAGYTELRLRRVWSSSVLVRDRTVESASTATEIGGVARCCSPGTGWGLAGFSGTERLDTRALQAHELSLAIASRQPVELAPIAVREHDGAAPIPEDPREVSLAEKRQHAETLAALLSASDRRITSTRVLCQDEVVETWLATSEGSWVHELRSEVSTSVLALAEEDGNVERAVGSVRIRGGWHGGTAGTDALIERVASRAIERLHAVPVRSGRYAVVLDRAAAGALMHRAVTHLARPNLPGADPDVLPLGMRIGPECLTVGDDPTAPGLSASSVSDDEGTGGRRTVIVQNGVVVGHLHSRETAAAEKQAPTGHARAGSLRGAPYPRATNSFLAQGQGSLDDLLQGIPLGVYVIDALACEAAGDQLALRAGSARMIRNGRLAEPVKGVQISGGFLPLLGRVEAVAEDFAWDVEGSRCRDGAAGVVAVTTGAPHVRLVDVAIGEGIS